jgi:hypothetical protein
MTNSRTLHRIGHSFIKDESRPQSLRGLFHSILTSINHQFNQFVLRQKTSLALRIISNTSPSSLSVVRPERFLTQRSGRAFFPWTAPTAAPTIAAMVSLSLVSLTARTMASSPATNPVLAATRFPPTAVRFGARAFPLFHFLTLHPFEWVPPICAALTVILLNSIRALHQYDPLRLGC